MDRPTNLATDPNSGNVAMTAKELADRIVAHHNGTPT